MKFTLRVFHPDKGANVELGPLRPYEGAPDLFTFCLDTLLLNQCLLVYPGDASATFYPIPRDGSLKLYVFGTAAADADGDITYYGETADADCYVYFVPSTRIVWVVVAATRDAGVAKIKEAL